MVETNNILCLLLYNQFAKDDKFMNLITVSCFHLIRWNLNIFYILVHAIILVYEVKTTCI